MSLAFWYSVTAVTLFVLGLYGLVAGRFLLRKILAANIMGSGVFLLLVALAHRRPAAAPDPVPHAMVLTGIVVAVSATAVGLALARRIQSDAAGGEPAGDVAGESPADDHDR